MRIQVWRRGRAVKYVWLWLCLMPMVVGGSDGRRIVDANITCIVVDDITCIVADISGDNLTSLVGHGGVETTSGGRADRAHKLTRPDDDDARKILSKREEALGRFRVGVHVCKHPLRPAVRPFRVCACTANPSRVKSTVRVTVNAYLNFVAASRESMSVCDVIGSLDRAVPCLM